MMFLLVRLTKHVFASLLVILLILSSVTAIAASSSSEDNEEPPFILVGVSGTLQDGFELRNRLDYKGTKARFVGKALVRGYKAYLDIKPKGWREYKSPPLPPQVPNAVVSK